MRPTTDRVREALFSVIGPRLLGADVLDLFAGTGALGIEALSRGADFAIFVEQAAATVRLVSANIATCDLSGRARILRRDALAALRQLANQGKSFDLIFLDPPYQGPLLEKVLRKLASSTLLKHDALIIAEHPFDRPPTLPAELKIVTTKRYGKTILSFIQDADVNFDPLD